MRNWRQYVKERLGTLRIRPEREFEIIDELALQLEQAYKDALSDGSTAEEADRKAESEFPDWRALAHAIEAAELPENREPSPAAQRFLSGIPQDLRHALRVLRKNPLFTCVAVLTLAIGIGGCTAIFGLVDAVLLRPIDYSEPDRLVMVWENNVKRGVHNNVAAMADYLDWKARSHVFSELCIVLDQVWNLTAAGDPEELTGISVSTDFLPMLGVQPLLGRSFTGEEGKPGGPHVAILSHSLWVRKFGADRAALGKTLKLDETPTTIIGVLPAGFPWLGKQLDILTPAQMPARDWRKNAGRFLRVAGRLKPGIPVDRASSELNSIARQLEVEYPEFNKDWGVDVVPIPEHFAGDARASLYVLMGAVGLVLLIACSNVANLLLARATAREREMALRGALGASSGRLMRMLLIESVALALSGGILGSAVAYAAIRLIQTYGPQDVSRLETAGFSLPVAGFAMAASLLTGILFGLAPALTASRMSLSSALKEGGRGVVNANRGNRLRSVFVVAQVALALVLLTAAGLLLQSLARLSATPTGFDPDHVLTATISISGKMENEKLVAITTGMVEQIRRLPGVQNASFITFLPFAGMGAATSFRVEGGPAYAPGQEPVTDVRIVQPGYFETMKIPLIRGRLFTSDDNRTSAPRTFIVNQALAKQMFAGSDPLGQRLIVQMGDAIPGQIVGVAADTKHKSLDGSVRPMVYYTQAQLPISFGSLVVRTTTNPESLASALTAAVHEVKSDQPVPQIRTMEQWIGRSIARERFQTALLTAFAVIALLLAMIGVYGVMSYSVEQRTHEIGVRVAIGAQPAEVLRWITGQGMGLVAIGLVLGLIGAAASTRVLKSLLYGVTPGDPLTFAATAAVLALVCFAAIYIPARRATSIDSLIALRWE